MRRFSSNKRALFPRLRLPPGKKGQKKRLDDTYQQVQQNKERYEIQELERDSGRIDSAGACRPRR